MRRLLRPIRSRKFGLTAFTLIEILIVMAILAIAAAMIIPNSVSASDVAVVSAARMIAMDLQYAQNLAITGQAPITVTFTLSPPAYALTNASVAVVHPITRSSYSVSFAGMSGFQNLTMESANFGGHTYVVFDEFGAPDNAGSVTIRVGTFRYRVDVAAATGKITVTAL
jgi:prepilin-type N-terminal cleavage/methylation domain-containing protein